MARRLKCAEVLATGIVLLGLLGTAVPSDARMVWVR
jgi:hypothetical protein